MTKVDIISGFLGAGKTTLIRKLIQESFPDETVVLIENEFGEIGIDGGFLKDSGIQIREMNSGCICCSLVGDFAASLKEVTTTWHPDRILIEPSGVGKLSDIIRAVDDVQEAAGVKTNSFTTVIDTLKCELYLENFGEFYTNQIEYAGAVILSRTDKADADQVEKAIQMIRKLNPKAALVTTPISALTGDQILSVMEGGDSLRESLLAMIENEPRNEEHEHHDHHDHDHDHHDHDHHHKGHDADDVFASWGVETAKRFTEEEISNILKELENRERYGMVLRAKGMVEGPDKKWIDFDMVPGEYDIREGQPEFTGRICVIGSEINEENLSELFRA